MAITLADLARHQSGKLNQSVRDFLAANTIFDPRTIAQMQADWAAFYATARGQLFLAARQAERAISHAHRDEWEMDAHWPETELNGVVDPDYDFRGWW